jgi:hypothetical protein
MNRAAGRRWYQQRCRACRCRQRRCYSAREIQPVICGAQSGRIMPRDGAIIFSDLLGKLDVLEVACDKCGRKGRYGVARLIEQRGSDGKVVDLLAELKADCPKQLAGNMSDQCAARCPDLPRVM